MPSAEQVSSWDDGYDPPKREWVHIVDVLGHPSHAGHLPRWFGGLRCWDLFVMPELPPLVEIFDEASTIEEPMVERITYVPRWFYGPDRRHRYWRWQPCGLMTGYDSA